MLPFDNTPPHPPLPPQGHWLVSDCCYYLVTGPLGTLNRPPTWAVTGSHYPQLHHHHHHHWFINHNWGKQNQLFFSTKCQRKVRSLDWVFKVMSPGISGLGCPPPPITATLPSMGYPSCALWLDMIYIPGNWKPTTLGVPSRYLIPNGQIQPEILNVELQLIKKLASSPCQQFFFSSRSTFFIGGQTVGGALQVWDWVEHMYVLCWGSHVPVCLGKGEGRKTKHNSSLG